MAVQGQTSGTIDEINIAQGINRVAGIDFLLCDPTGDLKSMLSLHIQPSLIQIQVL